MAGGTSARPLADRAQRLWVDSERGSETMIEQIQGRLRQAGEWLGAAPPTWYLGAGLAIFAALLLAALIGARRSRLRAAASRQRLASSAPAGRANAAPAAAVAGQLTAAAAPVAAGEVVASPPRLADPAARMATTTSAAHALAGGDGATSSTTAGVAVAERMTSTPAGTESADEVYRQARKLLEQPGGDAETLRRAVALLRRAQEVWTRDAAPELWAVVQNDIGSAYQEMPNGNRAANLSAAIAHHESALEVFDPLRHALRWAWTQSALAAAYQSLPTGSTISNARAAVAYHQRALDVLTADNAPLSWAWNQNNLGAAYELMRGGADGDRVRALQDAANCYAAALRVYTSTRYPVQHQIVTQNLLRVQGELRAIE